MTLADAAAATRHGLLLLQTLWLAAALQLHRELMAAAAQQQADQPAVHGCNTLTWMRLYMRLL